MSQPPALDPKRATEELQEAVRTHDRARLEECVSDRLVFVSGRALGRLGKAEWIDAALQVRWLSFAVGVVRTLDLGNAVIVDHELEQELESPPDWATAVTTRSVWVTTDIWAYEDGIWRLVARHPELKA